MPIRTLKVPKKVSWDEIRELIGDQKTNDLITVKYGPKLLGAKMLRLDPRTVENMLSYVQGKTVEGMSPNAYMQAIPAVFRRYFQESPMAKTRFITWLQVKLENPEQNGAAPVVTRLGLHPNNKANRIDKETMAGTLSDAAAEMAEDTKKKRGVRGPYKKRQKVGA